MSHPQPQEKYYADRLLAQGKAIAYAHNPIASIGRAQFTRTYTWTGNNALLTKLNDQSLDDGIHKFGEDLKITVVHDWVNPDHLVRVCHFEGDLDKIRAPWLAPYRNVISKLDLKCEIASSGLGYM